MTLALRQGTPAWREARKALVTATDIPVLLGLSPYKCEADLADEKRGIAPEAETSLRMRVGSALEDLIAAEYERVTGNRTRRWLGLAVHRDIEWAAASPDRKRKGALVELKWTGSKSRFADGLPQDVEAQVAWQLGVTGYRHADVAVLVNGDELLVREVDADPALFENLVTVAADFRRRLAVGGPFSRDLNRIKRDYPVDNGTWLTPTPDLAELVEKFRSAKAAKAAAENAEKTIGNALRAVLLDASGIEGLVSYRKSADSTRVNWPAVASAYRKLLADHPASELDVIESIHSETVPGPRVLRLLKENRGD